MNEKQILGRQGENIACEFLQKIGYQIIFRNFSCRQGEIDIIAKDKETIVFVEVKTRKNLYFGSPAEAIDKRKSLHIIRTAKYFLHLNRLVDKSTRFDAIEILIKNGKFVCNHIKGIL